MKVQQKDPYLGPPLVSIGLNIALVSYVTRSIQATKMPTPFWNTLSNGTQVAQIVHSCKCLGVRIARHP